MLNPPLTIVAVDDNPADFGILRRRLQKVPDLNCHIIHCSTPHDAKMVLAEQSVDCMFLDYHLGATSGLDVLADIRTSGNDVPIITLTGQGNEAVAVEAMKLGAQDYLAKSDMTPEALHVAINNAIEKVALTRKLAETQAELQQFASTAAHDLKAPLRRIRQFCQLIQEKCQGNLNPAEYELLDFVVKNADQMHRLVESLMAYTCVGRSETPLHLVDLSRVLTLTCTNLGDMIDESQAQLHISSMPTVFGDETALVQLFQNLINNALKFCHSTPPIIVVESQLEADMWHLTLTDNGIGISPQHHDEIFAPFRRLHSSSEYEGSGIGLTTCRKIVHQHHGEIWVESELHHGTTFHILLPDPAVTGVEAPLLGHTGGSNPAPVGPLADRRHLTP